MPAWRRPWIPRHWFLIPDGSAISVEVFESVTCRLTRQVWTDQLPEPPFWSGR
jgi:hypothetical protein